MVRDAAGMFSGKKASKKRASGDGSGDEWDLVSDGDSVNGESVESEMAKERWVQGLRTALAGVGFAMGVVGIWGDRV